MVIHNVIHRLWITRKNTLRWSSLEVEMGMLCRPQSDERVESARAINAVLQKFSQT
jgi:hypothetical protein